jgi:phospholipid/cholesterol/gamma-HCH transport system permease protein
MSVSDFNLHTSKEAGSLVFELEGALDTSTSPGLSSVLDNMEVNDERQFILDLDRLERIDSTGVAVILDARERLAEQGVELRLRGGSERIRKVFKLTMARIGELVEEAPEHFWDPISSAGEAAVHFKQRLVETAVQLGEIAYWILAAPFRGQQIRIAATTRQITLVGADAIPIISLIALLIGLIMGMQAAHQLRQFGASIFVANLVGVATTRELGPLITAILVAGRSGSAIAAELGTMVVTEEIDALRTMGLNPIRYLVVPRVLALAIAVPLLAVLANLIAIFGGMLIGVFNLGLSFNSYFNQTIQAVELIDFMTGIVKALIFGLIIGNVGVFEGLHVRGGAEGVGRATTQAVVTSIFLIIIADAIFTALFFFV